jgi:hypothetical protein
MTQQDNRHALLCCIMKYIGNKGFWINYHYLFTTGITFYGKYNVGVFKNG